LILTLPACSITDVSCHNLNVCMYVCMYVNVRRFLARALSLARFSLFLSHACSLFLSLFLPFLFSLTHTRSRPHLLCVCCLAPCTKQTPYNRVFCSCSYVCCILCVYVVWHPTPRRHPIIGCFCSCSIALLRAASSVLLRVDPNLGKMKLRKFLVQNVMTDFPTFFS